MKQNYTKPFLSALLAFVMVASMILPLQGALAEGGDDRSAWFGNYMTFTIDESTVKTDNLVKIKYDFTNVPLFSSEESSYLAAGDYVDIDFGTVPFNPPSSKILLPMPGDPNSYYGYVEFTEEHGGQVKGRINFASATDAVGKEFNAKLFDLDTFLAGNFNFTLEYDATKDNNKEAEHEVTLLGKTFEVKREPSDPDFTAVKQGVPNWAEKTITWTVDITKRDLLGDEVPLQGVEFKDVLTDAGSYVSGSLTLGRDATPTNLQTAGNILSFTFGNTSTPQKVTYKTSLSDADYDIDANKVFENNATVTRPQFKPVPAKATVTMEPWAVKTGEIVVADGDGGYIKADETDLIKDLFIKWEIKINQAKEDLDTVTVTEVLPKQQNGIKLTYVEAMLADKVETKTITGVKGTETDDTVTYTYTLNDVKDEVTLVIIQRVDDKELTINEAEFTNTAVVELVDWSVTVTPDGKVGVGYAAGGKTGALDLENRRIDWTVDFALNGQPASGMVIYDLFVYDATAVPDWNAATLTLSSGTESDGPLVSTALAVLKLTGTDALNPRHGLKVLTEEPAPQTTTAGAFIKVYTVLVSGESVADLVVMSDMSSSEQNTFKFSTQMLDPKMFINNGGGTGNAAAYEDISIKNIASLYNSSNEKLDDITGTVSYRSRLVHKEMLKLEATLNADNTIKSSLSATDANKISSDLKDGFNHIDRTVVFRFSVNEHGIDWSQPIFGANKTFTLTDALPEGWSFVPVTGSDLFLVFEGTPMGPDTTATGSLQAKGTALSAQELVDAGILGSVAGTNASFTFTRIKAPYVVVVKAQLDETTFKNLLVANKDDQYERVNNSVTLTSDGKTFTSSQNVEIKKNVLKKNVTEINVTDSFIKWTVEYLPYGLSGLGNSIVDKLPTGIDVRITSAGLLNLTGNNFKMVKLTLLPSGAYQESGEVALIQVPQAGETQNIDYDTAERKLTFWFADPEQAYRVSYITDLTASVPSGASNTVTLMNGANPGSGMGYPFSLVSLGGMAYSNAAGKLELQKVGVGADASGLSGVGFTVFAQDDTTVIRTGTTGAGGRLTLRGLPAPGNYILRETSVPGGSGYVLSDRKYLVNIAANRDATIDSGVNDTDHIFKIVNYKEDITGNLSISKMVLPTGDAQEFSFTIRLTPPQGDSFGVVSSDKGNLTFIPVQSGNGYETTVKLRGGESIMLTGIPEGTVYAVTEAADADYTSDVSTGSAIGSILKTQTSSVEFTNTKKGSLTITKEVTGLDGAAADELLKNKLFTFYITLAPKAPEQLPALLTLPLTWNEGTGAANLVFNTEGKATVQLHHGESVTIGQIPAGWTYKVEERYDPNFDTTWTGDGEGTIVPGEEYEVNFKNALNPGSLTITKEVTGALNSQKEFEFTLELTTFELPTPVDTDNPTFEFAAAISDKNGQVGVEFSLYFNESGKQVTAYNNTQGLTPIKLSSGQSLIIRDMPKSMQVKVTEEDSSTYGYLTFVNGTEDRTVTLEVDGTGFAKEARFENRLGELSIKKQVAGQDGKRAYKFTVTLEDAQGGAPITGDITVLRVSAGSDVVEDTLNFGETGGTATFFLTNGEVLTIPGIPHGTKYTIVEESGPYGVTHTVNDGVAQVGAEAQGSVDIDDPALAYNELTAKVVYTNYMGGIVIRKEVKSGDTKKQFEFEVELSNDAYPFEEGALIQYGTAKGEGEFSYGNSKPLTGGKLTFTLAHDEAIDLSGLPEGTVYTVTEKSQGYTVKHQTGGGALENGADATGTLSFANDPAEDAYVTILFENTAISSGGPTEPGPTANVKLRKVNEAGVPLAGAQFGLYSLKGALLYTTTSGSDGMVYFRAVPYGAYKIKEIAAPVGYELSTEVIEVTLAYAGTMETKPFNVVNKAIPDLSSAAVPQTGGESGTLAAFALMTLGAALMALRAPLAKKRRAK